MASGWSSHIVAGVLPWGLLLVPLAVEAASQPAELVAGTAVLAGAAIGQRRHPLGALAAVAATAVAVELVLTPTAAGPVRVWPFAATAVLAWSVGRRLPDGRPVLAALARVVGAGLPITLLVGLASGGGFFDDVRPSGRSGDATEDRKRRSSAYADLMAVHLTRIYTRTGDDGTTALGDFSRVRKTDVRLAAYADTDECNAAVGVAVTVGGLAPELLVPLRQVQNDLFDVGADLCAPIVPDPQYPPLRITEEYVTRLEAWCDEFNEGLPKLDSFVLSGGTPGAAYLHVARTVARRAERSVWALIEADAERTNPLTAKYLNRLSDLLFILGRAANPGGDVLWRPGGAAG